MKKKILLITTFATMALALCACNEKSKDNQTPTDATTEAASSTDAATEATTEAVTEATTEEPVSANVATRGVIENGIFTNEYFDISFPIDEEFPPYPDNMIVDITGMPKEILDENGTVSINSFEELTQGYSYDLMLSFPDMQSGVTLNYQNLDYIPESDSFTAETYAATVKLQAEQMDPNYTINEPVTETYGGYEYICLDATTTYGFSKKMLFRQQDNYIVMFTITYLDETPELCTDFLASITSVK